LKALATLRWIADRIYIIRCTDNAEPQLALSFRGALSALAYSGRDASVHTAAGTWVAGRRLGA